MQGSPSSSQRIVTPRTKEVITTNIRSLLLKSSHSCIWLTVTFPRETSGYDSREAALRSWRTNFFAKTGGKAVFVVQKHLSGEVHYHAVVYFEGRNFSSGFNHSARERWVSSRSEKDRNHWMNSASSDLRWLWSLREGWKASYGLGHCDIVPFRPGTDPLAVSRYMSAYTSEGEPDKGRRVYRLVGWPKSEEKPLVANRKWVPSGEHASFKGKPVPTFSLVGARSSVFGALKLRGDNGSRGRGWSLVAVVRGFQNCVRDRWLHWNWPYGITSQVVKMCIQKLTEQAASAMGVYWAKLGDNSFLEDELPENAV